MADLNITLQAGPHRRVNCPVSVHVQDTGLKNGATLTGPGGVVPCQTQEEGDGVRISWIVSDLGAGESETYSLTQGGEQVEGVALEEGSDEVAVSIGGKPFTTYRYGAELARPHLYPVIGPYGDPVTRRLATPEDGKNLDHHHHRSVWIAHGEVNAWDNWSEGESHAKTEHQQFELLESGPVFGKIVATSIWNGIEEWKGPPGKKRELLEERAEWTFYNTPPEVRMFDLRVTLTSRNMDVLFGDTKEGGLASIRVEESMEVKRGLGGKIENGIGGIDEDETWGKRAPWCHYTGPVNDQTVGVAIMDHPDSFRHPTYWHVRNYGLMTANPFGLSYFYKDTSRRGHHLLEPGDSIVGIYRFYFHKGDATEGKVKDRYHDFAHPPKVDIE